MGAEPRGETRGSAPHRGCLAVEHWSVRVGEDDRPRRIVRAQAIEVPSGGADRVEHTLVERQVLRDASAG
jgi:hypothetical protein